MTRAADAARRQVQENLVGAAACTLPEELQIAAVQEVSDLCRAAAEALRLRSLPAEYLEHLLDLPALLDVEAEDRAERGDRTSVVWAAAAEQMRLRARVHECETQLPEED